MQPVTPSSFPDIPPFGWPSRQTHRGRGSAHPFPHTASLSDSCAAWRCKSASSRGCCSGWSHPVAELAVCPPGQYGMEPKRAGQVIDRRRCRAWCQQGHLRQPWRATADGLDLARDLGGCAEVHVEGQTPQAPPSTALRAPAAGGPHGQHRRWWRRVPTAATTRSHTRGRRRRLADQPTIRPPAHRGSQPLAWSGFFV